MPVDQHAVNRWPGSISRNTTGNKTFQVKQNQSWAPCKAAWNHPHYCLRGRTAILAGRTRRTMLSYSTVSYVKQFYKAFITKGWGSYSSQTALDSVWTTISPWHHLLFISLHNANDTTKASMTAARWFSIGRDDTILIVSCLSPGQICCNSENCRVVQVCIWLLVEIPSD